MKFINKIFILIYGILVLCVVVYGHGGDDFVKRKFLNDEIKVPKELYVCFDEFDKMIDDKDKKEFIKAGENELAGRYHFGIGLYIRNYWIRNDGLNIKLEEVLTSLGIHSTDDMSGIIITSYHRYLNKKEIRLKEQIEEHNNPVNPYAYSDLLNLLQFSTILQLLIFILIYKLFDNFKKGLYYFIFIATSLLWILTIVSGVINIFSEICNIFMFLDICVFLTCLVYYFACKYREHISKKML